MALFRFSFIVTLAAEATVTPQASVLRGASGQHHDQTAQTTQWQKDLSLADVELERIGTEDSLGHSQLSSSQSSQADSQEKGVVSPEDKETQIEHLRWQPSGPSADDDEDEAALIQKDLEVSLEHLELDRRLRWQRSGPTAHDDEDEVALIQKGKGKKDSSIADAEHARLDRWRRALLQESEPSPEEEAAHIEKLRGQQSGPSAHGDEDEVALIQEGKGKKVPSLADAELERIDMEESFAHSESSSSQSHAESQDEVDDEDEVALIQKGKSLAEAEHARLEGWRKALVQKSAHDDEADVALIQKDLEESLEHSKSDRHLRWQRSGPTAPNDEGDLALIQKGKGKKDPSIADAEYTRLEGWRQALLQE